MKINQMKRNNNDQLQEKKLEASYIKNGHLGAVISFTLLKTLDNIGNCQRPVSLGVYQHMHKITDL